MGDIEADHDQGDDHVGQTHEGHDQTGQPDDPFTAADQAVPDKNSQNAADDQRSDPGMVETIHREGGLKVVGA